MRSEKEVETSFVKSLDQAVAEYGLSDEADIGKDDIPLSMRRRRGYDPKDYDGLATLSLVRIDGILRWDYQPPDMSSRVARRARRGNPMIGSDVIHSFSFKETPPNEVISGLEALDRKLTPDQGLRVIKNKTLQKADEKLSVQGRTLLLVHGTFSNSDMYIKEFGAIAAQNDLLARAQKKYDAILAFDHPTLSVSPWINALDLELALANVTGPIDVICHSRGGLVVAWWLRNSRRNVENVVFVGSPLMGTSLASPAHLRAALDMLANVIKAFEAISVAASTVVPLAAGVAGLAKIVGGIVDLGANTPLVDAAVAIVPGLVGQSRVGNNAELIRLTRAPWISTPTFYAVKSNFEPVTTEPWWQFWKRIRKLPTQIVNRAADTIFDGDNDLVVDTGSMDQICNAAIPPVRTCDFRKSPDVHHCNYFRQKQTVDFLTTSLKM